MKQRRDRVVPSLDAFPRRLFLKIGATALGASACQVSVNFASDASLPAGRRPAIRVRRNADFLGFDLRLSGGAIQDGTIRPTAKGAVQIVVEFAPQHIAELAFDELEFPRGVPKELNARTAARIARPSRLVYGLAPESEFDELTLRKVLALLAEVPVQWPKHAGAAAQIESVVEFPTGLELVALDDAKLTFPVQPRDAGEWQELWRAELGGQPLRATFARPFASAFDTTLRQVDRSDIVLQTNSGSAGSAPFKPERLDLSLLGALANIEAQWPTSNDLVAWTHRTFLGRDSYVRIVRRGVLFPWGHEARLVEVYERKLRVLSEPKGEFALILRRRYVEINQPERDYAHDINQHTRANPFKSLRFITLETPSLDGSSDEIAVELAAGPTGQQETRTLARYLRTGGSTFKFRCEATDQADSVHNVDLAAIWVSKRSEADTAVLDRVAAAWNDDQYAKTTPLHGKELALVPAANANDQDNAKLKSFRVVFNGEHFVNAAGPPHFGPKLEKLVAQVPGSADLFSSDAGKGLEEYAVVLANVAHTLQLFNRPTAPTLRQALDRARGVVPAAQLASLETRLGEMAAAADTVRLHLARARFVATNETEFGKAIKKLVEKATLSDDERKLLELAVLAQVKPIFDAGLSFTEPRAALAPFYAARARLRTLLDDCTLPETLNLDGVISTLSARLGPSQAWLEAKGHLKTLAEAEEAAFDKAGEKIKKLSDAANALVKSAAYDGALWKQVVVMSSNADATANIKLAEALAELESVASLAAERLAKLTGLASGLTTEWGAVRNAVGTELDRKLKDLRRTVTAALTPPAGATNEVRALLEQADMTSKKLLEHAEAGLAELASAIQTDWRKGLLELEIEARKKLREPLPQVEQAVRSVEALLTEVGRAVPAQAAQIAALQAQIAEALRLTTKATGDAQNALTTLEKRFAVGAELAALRAAQVELGALSRRLGSQLAAGIQTPTFLALRDEVEKQKARAEQAFKELQAQVVSGVVKLASGEASSIISDLGAPLEACKRQVDALNRALGTALQEYGAEVDRQLATVAGAGLNDAARAAALVLGARATVAQQLIQRGRESVDEFRDELDQVRAPLNQALSELRYHQTYLSSGIGNRARAFAEVLNRVASDFDRERMRGLISPDFSVQGLSLALGPISDLAGMLGGKFDPTQYFPDAKLLGGVRLRDILKSLDLPDLDPEVNRNVVPALRRVLSGGRPVLKYHYEAAGPNRFAEGGPFKPTSETKLSVDIEAELTGKRAATVEIELAKFQLEFFELIRLSITSANYRRGKFGVQIGNVQFLGAFEFFATLQSLLKFGGDTGPYLRIAPSGLETGLNFAVPEIGVGVFALQGITARTQLELPFTGEPGKLTFGFSSFEAPFRVSVALLGGGGFIELRANTSGGKAIDRFRAALEFGASVAVSFGFVSASASIMGGVYYEYSSARGSLLMGYYRLSAQVNLLGIVSVSIVFMLALVYANGVLEGFARVVIKVKILFFSKSFAFEVRRRFAGSPRNKNIDDDKNDVLKAAAPPALLPQLRRNQIITTDKWTAYRSAFDHKLVG